jgi:xanthine dehydrogenase YagR molybdenum-binding subunit
MTLVGAPVDRVDGRLKVTGAAPYSGDVNLPRMAHAVLVLSTEASGRITRMDTGVASQLPGVLAVLTHLNAWKLPEGGHAGVNPPAGRVLTLLQDEVVHFNRQPIGLVVA